MEAHRPGALSFEQSGQCAARNTLSALACAQAGWAWLEATTLALGCSVISLATSIYFILLCPHYADSRSPVLLPVPPLWSDCLLALCFRLLVHSLASRLLFTAFPVYHPFVFYPSHHYILILLLCLILHAQDVFQFLFFSLLV